MTVAENTNAIIKEWNTFFQINDELSILIFMSDILMERHTIDSILRSQILLLFVNDSTIVFLFCSWNCKSEFDFTPKIHATCLIVKKLDSTAWNLHNRKWPADWEPKHNNTNSSFWYKRKEGRGGRKLRTWVGGNAGSRNQVTHSIK